MPLKIRLQRHGKRGKPFYWIVAADSRAKRDGKYLDKIGTYNPLTKPATVNLDIDNAVKWLQNGAQPTDTARDLLSNKGVMLKNHLLKGVRKGALTEEEAEKKFQDWLDEKEAKLGKVKEAHEKSEAEEKAKALVAEQKLNAERDAAKTEAEQAEAEAEEANAEAEAENKATEDDGKTEIEKQAEAAEKNESADE